ncbi:MAG: aspartate aminotransferase family protein, partial [Gammaproteobacteria bacterium]|nr:aspartate aminotransferase family protein [Gammaproteobacteria bacterium]
KEIKSEEDVKRCDLSLFRQFFHGMLREGIYLAPSAFEAGFVSSAHGDEEIHQTLRAAEKIFSTMSTTLIAST